MNRRFHFDPGRKKNVEWTLDTKEGKVTNGVGTRSVWSEVTPVCLQ